MIYARLQNTLDYITDHPEELDQGVWAKRTQCGTVMCLAAHVVVSVGGTLIWDPRCPESSYVDLGGSRMRIASAAQVVLGLTDDQATSLFWYGNTLGDLWLLANRYSDGAIGLPSRERVPASQLDNHGWPDEQKPQSG